MKLILHKEHDFVNEETAYLLDSGLVYDEPFEVPSLKWLTCFIVNAKSPLMFSLESSINEAGKKVYTSNILIEHPYSY